MNQNENNYNQFNRDIGLQSPISTEHQPGYNENDSNNYFQNIRFAGLQQGQWKRNFLKKRICLSHRKFKNLS